MKKIYATLFVALLSMTTIATNAQNSQDGADPVEVPVEVNVITEAPAGETVYYNRVGGALRVNSNNHVEEVLQSGQMEVVYGEDGFVYLKDPICYYENSTYVKGTIDGSTITVPLGQQLRYYTGMSYYCSELWYGRVLRSYEGKVLSTGSVIRDKTVTEAVFEIDGENIYLPETNPNYVLGAFFDDIYRWVGFADYFDEGMLVETLTPQMPEIYTFEPNEDNTLANMTCFVPLKDVKDRDLLPENLYYRIYLDVEGEISTFELLPGIYNDVLEATTEIPYVFDNVEQITEGAATFQLITPLVSKLNNVGIQSVYYNEANGASGMPAREEAVAAPAETEIFWYFIKDYGGTAVNDIATAKTATGTRYYNMAGQHSNTPFNGVNIAVTTYSDGTTSATKVVR